MKENKTKLPLMIDTGVWDGGHIQGIAVDPEKGYIYYSYTTVLVKARLDGSVVGWVGGLLGHLGCIDFNDHNGKVYGSLEYKHDVIGRGIMNHLGVELAEEDAFYIAIFDVDKIDRPRMDAEKDGVMKAAYIPQVVSWYNGFTPEGEPTPFRVTGIDGLGIGPVFGGDGERLMLCSGTYDDPSCPEVSDYHVILQFDWEALDEIAAPLKQLQPHHFGLEAEAWYFLDIGNTTWGVQNLEYDAYDGSWIVCVYRGKKEGSPNHPMYVIDGKAVPVRKMGRFGFEHPHLVLKSVGVHHEETGLWGVRFSRGQTGVYAFGDGRYYFSHEFNTGDRRNSSVIRLYQRGENPRYLFEAVGVAQIQP
jgi:hypothetical protein